MNNNDLAALAALGAMGYMYKNHLDSLSTGRGVDAAAGRLPDAGEDYVNRGGAERAERFAPFPEVGTGGAGGRGDAARDAGTAIARENRDLAGAQRADRIRPSLIRGAGYGYGYGLGGGGGGSQAAAGYTDVVPGSALGNQGNFRLSTPDVAPPPDAVPEDRGMGGAGLAAAGLGATGAGAATYYARVKQQARLADEARAKMKAEAQRGILKDRAQTEVDADRDARARAQNEADRAARAQAQAEAEANSRAIQAEIDAELKKYKQKAANVKNDKVPLRPAVMNKEAWAAGPTVTSASTTTATAPPRENAARMTAAQKAAAKQAADMEAFNSMLREQKVGPAVEEGKRIKARGVAGKVGLGLTALGLGSAANAATNMTAGERERLASDVVEGLITPLGLTPSMAGEGSDLYPSKPLSSAERKKMIEAMSPADRKKMEEALARQNPKLFDRIKRPSAANQRAGGGQIKAKKMASGGMTSTVSSASKRGDGIASKGKTRCKMY